MAAHLNPELKDKINLAAKASEEFTKLYYDHVDNKKAGLSKLYMDNGLLVYNGNGFNGKDAITKFIMELPTTKHDLTTIDAQPILDNAGQAVLIQVSGTVKIGQGGGRSRAFQQTFTLTAENNKWKVVTDTFRLQDGICGEIKIE